MDALDLSRPHRVVLLVDLHPLLHLPDPAHYISPILSAARAVLSSPPLSSSLATHRLFFSSLSPVLSASRLHRLLGRHPSLLSFDRPATTLLSLSRDLHSLASSIRDVNGPSSPRASLLAGSLLRLEHDYAWDTQTENRRGMQQSFTFRSNLVLLFSRTPETANCSLEYIDLEVGSNDESFLKRFREVFRPASDGFRRRDIHLTWVDVNFYPQCEKGRFGAGLIESGIREMEWGYCSTNAILLGSSIVPFGLIFPCIGCSMKGIKSSTSIQQGGGELILEIADVSGKPLECKICDLEMLNLKNHAEGLDWGLFPWNGGKKDTVTIHVRGVWELNEGAQLMGNSSGLVLLRGRSQKSRRERATHCSGEFFADKVLELLSGEESGFIEGKPIWQLLLAFLYKQSYWARVSICNGNGSSLEGILKPFTINYAFLIILKLHYLDSSHLPIPVRSDSSGSKDSDGSRKRHSMSRRQVQDLTWCSFHDAVFTQADDMLSGLDLEEIYFKRECNKSKKMRFLKCWMRQVKKSSGCCLEQSNELEGHFNVNEEAKDGVAGSQQEHELQLQSSSPTGETNPTGSVTEEATPFSCLEDTEAFISSIPEKIEHGLCSEEVEIAFLAERLVCLCIHALLVKYGSEVKNVSMSEEADDVNDMKILTKLSHHLLRKPKDLASKYKGFNPASDLPSATCRMENKVREHELQILFRMEILQSKVGESIEETLRQKMIKEICSLLQNIEFNLQGDLFHGESLVDFTERTIKSRRYGIFAYIDATEKLSRGCKQDQVTVLQCWSRYAHSLGDVIHKIYSQMEFFSFDGDDVEVSGSVPSSNSDEQRKGQDDSLGTPEEPTLRTSSSQVIFKAGTSRHVPEDGVTWKENKDDVHKGCLMKAQERRDRDRRLSSFTSWMPDLHRVWALKQPRSEKLKSKSLLKPSKRRKLQVTQRDMVCETPVTRNEHSFEQGDTSSHKKPACSELNSCRSLSKALFQSEAPNSDMIP